MAKKNVARVSMTEFKAWYLQWYWVPRYFREITEMRLFLADQFDWSAMNERQD